MGRVAFAEGAGAYSMVNRCICHDVTFAELRALAARIGGGFEEVSGRTGCGTGCGLCVPYIRLMLRTGQTVFPVLRPADFERLTPEAERVRGKCPGGDCSGH